MILGDKQIREYLEQNNGVIGWKQEHINPNSIDLTLSNVLKTYKNRVLDCRSANETEEFEIPETGYTLVPNELYLATTNETLHFTPFETERYFESVKKSYKKSTNICGRVEGKSSLARLGMWVHITAGWIDSGFCGSLVLELAVVKPLIIYPNQKICQIALMESGEILEHYGQKKGSKYQGQQGVQASKMHDNF